MVSFHLAVLVTCFNRVAITLRGLESLFAAVDRTPDLLVTVFLVDDGSPDGTGDRVAESFPQVRVIKGNGHLFWSRGMVAAFQAARQSKVPFDAYLLFNDDVEVGENFAEFVATFRKHGQDILAGACDSPATGRITYSGFLRRSRLRPFSFDVPDLVPGRTLVDTFNANAVLVPVAVMEALDGLDPNYTHALGDLDLGLRAKSIGVSSFVFSPAIGTCEKGLALDERIKQSGFRQRVKLAYLYPNGILPYLHFARRHGIAWLLPVYAAHTILQRARMVLNR